jgi:hypothetical protein
MKPGDTLQLRGTRMTGIVMSINLDEFSALVAFEHHSATCSFTIMQTVVIPPYFKHPYFTGGGVGYKEIPIPDNAPWEFEKLARGGLTT